MSNRKRMIRPHVEYGESFAQITALLDRDEAGDNLPSVLKALIPGPTIVTARMDRQMSTQPLTPGTAIRIIPRVGKIVEVRMSSTNRHPAPNWTEKHHVYVHDEKPVYLVEFEDGSRDSLASWEIEEVGR